MTDFTFANPHFLWLIIPLIGGIIWRWLSTPASIAVSSTRHYTSRPPAKYFTNRHILLLLEGLAAIAFIIALARPQADIEIVPTTKEGTDIVLILDYSNSMDAYDPGPTMTTPEIKRAIRERRIKDRLGVARDQIIRFIKRRKGDRIGLVIFGVDAYPSVAPTVDHDYIISFVNQLENSLLTMAERGTNLAAGISTGVSMIKEHADNRRTMVLITDGDHTVEDEVYATPLDAAKAAQQENVVIHTVGIGDDNPYLPDHLARMGAPVGFDTLNLQKIAGLTGGQFFRVRDNAGFEQVMNTIDSLEKTSRQQQAIVYLRDLYPRILLAGTFLLALAFILRHTFLREFA